MKKKQRILLAGLLLFAVIVAYVKKDFFQSDKGVEINKTPPYNVLFIMVDDLRPDLGCYGDSIVKSPNIDKLAAEATVFKNQYVTVPTCGASRCSILTGLLHKETIELSNEACRLTLSNRLGDAPPSTFIANLRRHGYYTVGIGKISHYVDGYIYMDIMSQKVQNSSCPGAGMRCCSMRVNGVRAGTHFLDMQMVRFAIN